MWFKIAVLMIGLGMVGCMAEPGGLEGQPPQDVECPAAVQPPDPIPCLRTGAALAGHAEWLIDALTDGDASQVDAAAMALSLKVDQYESCSADVVDQFSAYAR